MHRFIRSEIKDFGGPAGSLARCTLPTAAGILLMNQSGEANREWRLAIFCPLINPAVSVPPENQGSSISAHHRPPPPC